MTPLPPPDPARRVIAVDPAVPADQAAATAEWLMVGGGLGAIVGSILPWGSVTTLLGTVAVAGTQGDGKLTLAVGAFVVAVGALALGSRASYHLVVLGLVAACAVVAITGYNALNMAALIAGAPDGVGVVDVGYGLWLTLAAGVSAIAGGALLVQRA